MLAPTAPLSELKLADWTSDMRRSILRQMIAVVSQPGILSFAGGLPDPALFPAQQYGEALSHVLTTDPKALQYGMPVAALKQHIVQLMAQRGVSCTENEIFLTTGAQQALDIINRLLMNPGDDMILESLIYTGATQVIAPYRPDIFTVPTDLETGIDVDAVETLLESGVRPPYLYLIPDAHNPLGMSISLEKRHQLIQLAREYQIPLVEDDPYGFLYYGEELSPPLRAMDDKLVFYLGSFSKIMAPALRLGWIVATEPLIDKVKMVKEACDLESSGLTQKAVTAYLDSDHLPAHLATLCQEYGHRRDAMLTALAQYFPVESRWTFPKAGMFIWVELPEEVNTAVLLETAVKEQKVAFIPGHAFAVNEGDATNCMRLNFSNCSVEAIEDGIKRLGEVIN